MGLTHDDAYAWRRMCTSFKEASAGLCKALASVSRHLLCISGKGPCSFDAFCCLSIDTPG